MPELERGAMRVHYTIDGDAHLPVLVLAHALGVHSAMWAPQREVLGARFRLLSFDARGHGRSGVPTGYVSVPTMAQDLIALLDHLGIERAHVCGLSMGGAMAQWVALHHAERIERLILCNTVAKFGTAQGWQERMALVNAQGVEPLVPTLMERWFSLAYRRAEPEQVAQIAAMLAATSPQGYVACCAGLRDFDLRADVGGITAPTLVIGGTYDTSTPPGEVRELAQAIPGARYLELEAAHLSNWACAPVFNAAVMEFLLARH